MEARVTTVAAQRLLGEQWNKPTKYPEELFNKDEGEAPAQVNKA